MGLCSLWADDSWLFLLLFKQFVQSLLVGVDLVRSCDLCKMRHNRRLMSCCTKTFVMSEPASLFPAPVLLRSAKRLLMEAVFGSVPPSSLLFPFQDSYQTVRVFRLLLSFALLIRAPSYITSLTTPPDLRTSCLLASEGVRWTQIR